VDAVPYAAAPPPRPLPSVRVTGSDDDRQTWAINGASVFSLSAKAVSLLPRDCKQFIPCLGHRLGFGDAAEPVGLALIMHYPLRDRRRSGLHCYTQ